MRVLDATYWNGRYDTKATGWDIGYVSTPLKIYIDQLENKEISILIPGAGSAYEAEYLWQLGFKNTFIIDISEKAVEQFKKRYPSFPAHQIYINDFFEHQGQYDLILEQTFFCALDPSLRKNYVQKMKSLIKPAGKLVGLLFKNEFPFEGPPFGGTITEYKQLFDRDFDIQVLEECTNSIKPREGSELFLIMQNSSEIG